MSKFFSKKYACLEAYVPGEQPQDMQYIKLNTNESPFPPSQVAQEGALKALKKLQLYPDPDCKTLAACVAEHVATQTTEVHARNTGTKKECAETKRGCIEAGLDEKNIILSNGSDEVLNFAFMAFCDEFTSAVFPDITYGFYPVFADVNNVPYREIPLDEKFRINPENYYNAEATIFIANPNAHTGIALTRNQIEAIIKNNPNNVVIIDEAYVDFGAESSLPLIHKYDNLLVIQTLSKSRSLAGARLGFAVGNAELICDLNTIRNSTNPYNINSMTMAAGIGALEDEEYTQKNCQAIIETREYTAAKLKKLGFELTESQANFLFMKHPEIDGGLIYEELKKRGVLVRHFTKERIAQYNRVTIGSPEQMDRFIEELTEVIKDN